MDALSGAPLLFWVLVCAVGACWLLIKGDKVDKVRAGVLAFMGSTIVLLVALILFG